MSHLDSESRVPAVSVLMPVYNAERYVAKATASILNQTFGDFELIVVDDGSTDGSLRILQGYAARDERIRLIARENRGFVATLNEAIELARAPLIARMDADDISFPERLEKQATFMGEHQGVVACGTRVLWIDEDGDDLCPGPALPTHADIDGIHMRGEGGAISHPSVMMRAQILRELGGYRSEFYPAEDYDLFLRMAERGQLANLPGVLLKYRVHVLSISHLKNSQQKQKTLVVLEEACHRRGVPVPALDRAAFLGHNAVGNMTKWTWWALRAGNLKTARKHALRAFVRAPWSIETWRVLYCALRGR